MDFVENLKTKNKTQCSTELAPDQLRGPHGHGGSVGQKHGYEGDEGNVVDAALGD